MHEANLFILEQFLIAFGASRASWQLQAPISAVNTTHHDPMQCCFILNDWPHVPHDFLNRLVPHLLESRIRGKGFIHRYELFDGEMASNFYVECWSTLAKNLEPLDDVFILYDVLFPFLKGDFSPPPGTPHGTVEKL